MLASMWMGKGVMEMTTSWMRPSSTVKASSWMCLTYLLSSKGEVAVKLRCIPDMEALF